MERVCGVPWIFLIVLASFGMIKTYSYYFFKGVHLNSALFFIGSPQFGTRDGPGTEGSGKDGGQTLSLCPLDRLPKADMFWAGNWKQLGVTFSNG